jgi:PPM family protein phosphatase
MVIPEVVAAPRGLKWSGRTECGPVRPNNEDAFLGLQFDAREVHYLGRIGEGMLERVDYAFAVSDGMGGAKAGEYASQIAVQKITALLPSSFRHTAGGLQEGYSDVMEELFEQIHSALQFLGRSYEECRGMEATLSLCWFRPGWMYFGHIGDSRIYYLPARGGPIKQLTHDDTHVGWLYRTGQISEYEARNHPRRNMLQKALGGSNQFVSPQVGAVGYDVGDVFLLCTDGLTQGLHDNDLAELISFGEGPADKLVKESVQRSGRDNTTALVIHVI